MSEELLVGDAIYTDCVATDEDATNLGKIIYTVVSSTDDAFTVNASTGVISIAKLLNREAFATYVVVIRATDQGGTALGGALVRCAFWQKSTLEDAIGSPACLLEANTRVTNGIPLGSSLLLPVCTVNCVQTLKVPPTL